MERETAVTTKRVQDTETAIMQELKDITTAESAWATTRNTETTFDKMLNAIRDSLSDLASSDKEHDGEDKEDDKQDAELSKLSDDDEPGWAMGTISKTVQYRMESFWQKQMRRDELTQPGWGDAAHYFLERDMKYGTAKLKGPAVVKPQMDTTAATPAPPPFSEHRKTLHIFCRQSPMPAVTSRPGSSQMRLGSDKQLLHKFLPVLPPDAAPDLTLMQDAKPFEPISVYPSIKHPY